MGDEDDRGEFIKSNLTVLSESTVIGTPLILRLYEKGLIDAEEKYLLNNPITPDITRVMMLYTTTANKWNQSQFEEFKEILKATGNSMALQVFTNAGADCFLTNEQVQLIRQQLLTSDSGCYEGMEFGEEVNANKIIQHAKGNQLFKNGKFDLSGGLERKEIVRLVKQFAETFKSGRLWWNPRKPPFPPNYISRRIMRISANSQQETTTLLKQTESAFVLLVDAPGMGKSSEVTRLEQLLRKQITSNRIILRINLNEIQKLLPTISQGENASNVLLKLAPFLPSKIFTLNPVSVFVILDGLDEVCPKHQVTMINLLRILTS